MTESQTVSIALSHLKPSAHNVRQSAADNIESLAHSILSQGVLQNLVVVGTGAKGTYEVVARPPPSGDETPAKAGQDQGDVSRAV